MSLSFLLLLLLPAWASGLKCWSLTKGDDLKTIADGGLIECPPEHLYCIYKSATMYLPREKSRYPIQLETSGCGTGMSYEEKDRQRYVNLTLQNLCGKSLALPQKWDYTYLAENEPAYRVQARLNDVKCCNSDGCNEQQYREIGGGEATSWYEHPLDWLKGKIYSAF